MSLESLGLKENVKYGDVCRAEIFHKPSDAWFPVEETRSKVVYYRDSNDKVRKARADKISEVNIVDENKPEPLNKGKEKEAPEQKPLAMGLFTNTNYRGAGVEVEHENKGKLTLDATANKVLYVYEEGERRRMTLSKLVGVSGIEDPEKEDEDILTNKESPDSLNEEFDFREEVSREFV